MMPIPATGRFSFLRRRCGLLLAVLLAACAPALPAARVPLYPVSEPVPAPRMVTFLLPGALSTAEVFGPAHGWGGPDHLVVEYRLPGMQGEPVSPALLIDRAATWVADYTNRYPEARINLLGFSTGAAIAIEASGRITDGNRVRVAAVSSATPFPGAVLATLRGAVQVAGAALSAGVFDGEGIWEEYFKTLLFGTAWHRDPMLAARAEALLARWRDGIVAPGGNKGRAQAGNLLVWTLSPEARRSDAQIVLFHGAHDPIFPLVQIRLLAGALDAGICAYPDGGHLLFLTHPDLMARIETYLFSQAPVIPCD
jgi:pimeloyl-ACP methyl ester carboxylesterase